MQNNNLQFKLALALIPGVGAGLVRSLVASTGSPEAVFKENIRALQKIPGVGETLSTRIRASDTLSRAEEEMRFMRKEGIESSFLLDADYPDRLKQCPDAPVIFFYKGVIPNLTKTWLSIIGTRSPTSRGTLMTTQLVRELAGQGHHMVIVSGLAYGIDIHAHRAALSSGLPTVAVLGHGFHTIYPSIHRSTADDIMKNGCLITDFFSFNKLEPKNFIRRNRIIAGLSEATLVVESGIKGGATTTAEMANSYNRDVFAIPGRVSDPMSKGCNWLIRTHQATLVEQAGDLEYFMGLDQGKPKGGSEQIFLFESLDENERNIVNLIRMEAQSIDSIARSLNLPVQKISGVLLQLELKGLVRASPGKRFGVQEDLKT